MTKARGRRMVGVPLVTEIEGMTCKMAMMMK